MQNVEVTKIEPSSSGAAGFRELWQYRELIYFLTWRDVKVRYKQTAVGIAWVILQPLLTTAVFTIVFSTFARFDTGSVAYPLFALSGLMMWLYINTAVTAASGSFTGNTNLITKVYFPRLIVPLAAVAAGLIDLIFSFAVLIVLMIYYRTAPTANIVIFPLFIVLAVWLAAAVGVLFAALNVKYRDVRFALPFLLQVWMIASPIFYPLGLLSPKWRLIFALNPLTGILEGVRATLFGGELNWEIIAISTVSLALLIAVALAVFKRMEDDLADMI